MERKKRESITEKVRASILKGCRKNEIYDRKKFVQTVEEISGLRYGIDYKETHLAGVLASLARKGDIICIERGKYKIEDSGELNANEENNEGNDNINNVSVKEDEKNEKDEENKCGLKENCEDNEFMNVKRLVKISVQKECSYLKKVSHMKVSIEELEKKDFNDMMRIKELIDYLEKFQLS